MIVLPSYPPRRAWLQSFGIETAVACGVLLFAGGLMLGGGKWGLALSLSATVVLLIFAFCRPRLFALPYRIWNRLASEISSMTRWWILRTLYLILIVSAGTSRKAREKLGLARPGGTSSWKGRGTGQASRLPLNPIAGGTPAPLREHISNDGSPSLIPASRSGRFRALAAQWRNSDEIWALRTLPFLFLLSVVETRPIENETRENIYTLF